MEKFILLFLALSILSIPMIYAYKSHDAYVSSGNKFWSSTTLGNFGFSRSECSSVNLDYGEF